MHREIHKSFKKLKDLEWIDLIFNSVDSQVINGVNFPGFPKDNIQIEMIGSCGKNALYEPKKMYEEIRRISKEQKISFNKSTTLLDFACGYGRNVRFFMKDIFPGNLYGSDVKPDFIKICCNAFSFTEDKNEKTSKDEVIFDINNPFPPLRYKNKSFNFIMAYSLFSHLSEDAHLLWLKEFLRILRQDGLLFLSIRQQSFLSFYQNLILNNNASDYEKYLSNIFGNSSIQDRYNNGEYIYNPTGGGPGLSNDFYGDTVIPDKYINTRWLELFDIVEHYDDPSRLPQAFICLRPKKNLDKKYLSFRLVNR
jgi:SAM-dependent methyltransferase